MGRLVLKSAFSHPVGKAKGDLSCGAGVLCSPLSSLLCRDFARSVCTSEYAAVQNGLNKDLKTVVPAVVFLSCTELKPLNLSR